MVGPPSRRPSDARGLGPAVPKRHAHEPTLLAEWRRCVRPGETIICLGDVAHFDAWHDDSRLRLDVAGCPGERLLILGNHDIYLRTGLAAAGFERQRAAAICDTDPVLALTHAPLQRVPPNTVNIHGHLHGRPGPTERHRNLSIERTGYRPVRLDEVLADLAPSLTPARRDAPATGRSSGPERSCR